MATVAIILGGAIANALAFTGGNYLFSKLDHRDDGSAERERHDKAMEQLQTATSKWNEDRIKTLNFLNRELQAKQQANPDFNNVDQALQLYNEDIVVQNKPQFSDYYEPSEKQTYYEYVFIIGSTLASSYAIYKLIS